MNSSTFYEQPLTSAHKMRFGETQWLAQWLAGLPTSGVNLTVTLHLSSNVLLIIVH